MQRREVFAIVTLATALAFVVGRAIAQEPIPRQPPPRIEISPLEKRVLSLEQRTATLEQQNAELRRFIAINGDAMRIVAKDSVYIETQKALTVRAAESMTIKGASFQMEAGGTGLIKVGSDLNLESGTTLRMRSPTPATVVQGNSVKNLARSGDSVVNGVIQ
jgi:hypothetical protein